MKAWSGPAAGQVKDDLPDVHLEGGWEQIVFNISRADSRNDVTKFYERGGERKDLLEKPIDRSTYDSLSESRKADYLEIRESINHPNISGPFETNWGYSDFGGDGLSDRIGLPTLPGQVTRLAK